MKLWFKLLELLLGLALIVLVGLIAWTLQMATAEKLAFVYGNGFGATLALFVSYCVPLALGLKLILEKVHIYFSRFK